MFYHRNSFWQIEFSPHILHLKMLANSCLIWLHKKAIMIWQKLVLRKVPCLDFAWRYDNSFFLKWIWQIKAAVLIMRKVITSFFFLQEKKCENPLIWKIHFSLLPNYHIASSFELDHPKKRLLIAKFLKKAYQNCHEILSFETFYTKLM